MHAMPCCSCDMDALCRSFFVLSSQLPERSLQCPAPFQLLAFSLNRGPLAHSSLNWKQFTALLVLPVVAKHGARSLWPVVLTDASVRL
jgi:hypothetical protein